MNNKIDNTPIYVSRIKMYLTSFRQNQPTGLSQISQNAIKNLQVSLDTAHPVALVDVHHICIYIRDQNNLTDALTTDKLGKIAKAISATVAPGWAEEEKYLVDAVPDLKGVIADHIAHQLKKPVFEKTKLSLERQKSLEAIARAVKTELPVDNYNAVKAIQHHALMRGYKFSEDDVVDILKEVKEKMRAEKPICEACGEKVSSVDGFCGKCGNNLRLGDVDIQEKKEDEVIAKHVASQLIKPSEEIKLLSTERQYTVHAIRKHLQNPADVRTRNYAVKALQAQSKFHDVFLTKVRASHILDAIAGKMIIPITCFNCGNEDIAVGDNFCGKCGAQLVSDKQYQDNPSDTINY